MAIIETAGHRRSSSLRPPPGDIVAGLAVFVAVVAPLLFLRFHTGKYPVDLAVYREAGRVVLHGGDPYAPGFGRDLRVPLPFTYPPFSALASVGMAILSPGLTLAVWTVISLAFLLAMSWLVLRPPLERAGLGRGPLLGLAFGALAWTMPLALTISFGQVNLPLVLACILDCTWTSRRRGVLVGIATAVKLTPGLFIAYFAVTRQWAAAVRAAAAAAVCALIAFVLLPRPSREYWLHLVFDPRRIGRLSYYSNQSLLGVLTRLHAPQWLWAPLALPLAVVGLWRARRAHLAGMELAAVALVGLTTLLVSPISWLHHAVWIVPVLAVLIAWGSEGSIGRTPPSGRPQRLWAAVGLLVLFLIPFPSLGHRMQAAGVLPFVGAVMQNSYALAYLVLLLALPLVSVTRSDGGMEGRRRAISG
jgi:alpha-1,2-mannosyltransferase